MNAARNGGDDARWMGAALALGERGRGRSAPNPNVGCVIVNNRRVVGRGWTQPGGRPHAEAMALADAGDAARGATVYTTLEPCAHVSERGPACSDLLELASVARVVVALGDPDPRTDGAGVKRLHAAGIDVAIGVRSAEARRAMAGFLCRRAFARPQITLKLALSLDGAMALESGASKWITGPEARAHGHLERARHEAILVGRGTLEADEPVLDVRLAGLEGRSPRRLLLSRRPSESWGLPGGGNARAVAEDSSLRWGGGWEVLSAPADVAKLENVDHLLVEGGPTTAAAFLAADLVDRILLYRAPILVGGGRILPDIGLTDLTEAHGRWTTTDTRTLGSDRLEVYDRVRDRAVPAKAETGFAPGDGGKG